MAAKWYYTQDGHRHGPVSASHLKELAASGDLLPSDQVWKVGTPNWRLASSIQALFPQTHQAELGHGQSQSSSARRFWERTGNVADHLGRIASDAVAPGGFDGYAQLSGDTEQPAIYLQSEFFGGRTRIGAPFSSLDALGARIGTLIFSWVYLIPFLRSLASAWEFLPFTRTEFVRITLRQTLIWRRIFPVFITWLCAIAVTGVACIVVGVFASGIREFLGDTLGALASLILPLTFFGGYAASNLLAYNVLRALDHDDLHRSQIVLTYGFPQKYRLLSGLSDAPVEKQIDGVLALCKALSNSEFGEWSQISGHGVGNGMVGAIFDKVRRL